MDIKNEEHKNSDIEQSRLNRLKNWCNEHKQELLIGSISIGVAIIGIILHENDAATQYHKWFKNASIDELKNARKIIQEDFNNPALDDDYRSSLYDVLNKFDIAISKKQPSSGLSNFPVHSENGWYGPSD